MRYLFEDFALDTERRELHRGAETVPVAPQVFDLLDYLISNRERVIFPEGKLTKGQLADYYEAVAEVM